MTTDTNDFKVVIRRLPGYEPLVTLRFEMNEGYGELLVGDRRRASPAALGEVTDVTGERVRAGRFVHVLASGRRRQSYALSRIDDDRLQRLPDDKWTELVPITEFGIRYLDLPEMGPAASVAAIQVSANPATPRTGTPSIGAMNPREAGPGLSLPPRPTPVTSVTPGDDPQRMVTPVLSGSVGSAPVRTATGTPAPRVATPGPTLRTTASAAPRQTSGSPVTRTVVPPAAGALPEAPVSLDRALAEEAVRRLSTDDLRAHLLAETAKVQQLLHAIADLESRLADSRAREADLLEILARWQDRG